LAPGAMICQQCQKNPATVHSTELEQTEQGAYSYQERHLCELCAAQLDLPHAPASKKSAQDIWKLLQLSANQARKRAGPACPQCGMTLEEFRKKGRLGCAHDYVIFAEHLGELLERIHGARLHQGRKPQALPASPQPDLARREREERIQHLRAELEDAIRKEAYESAARLRDELKAIEERS